MFTSSQVFSRMAIRGISRDLLAMLFELGREHHPNEFVAVLREQGGVIRELDLVPGTIVGRESASFFVDMLPLGIRQAGSAHSHPNGVLSPSPAESQVLPGWAATISSSGTPTGRGPGGVTGRMAPPRTSRWLNDPRGRDGDV